MEGFISSFISRETFNELAIETTIENKNIKCKNFILKNFGEVRRYQKKH
jgi:hypothetical protein